MTAKCNLIIDSCCDLPVDLIPTDGVTMLNYSYIIDNVTYPDDFFQTVPAKEFYDMMRAGATPSTSMIAPGVLRAALIDAVKSGIPTVYLSMSSGISSNYESACLVLNSVKEEYPDAELYVVDTKQGCTPEGVIVLEAARQRALGLTATEMVAWAEEATNFINTMFMVEDLHALHRGGRLPGSVAVAGTALNVKPLLHFDITGHLGVVGVARGRKKGIKQLLNFFETNRDTTGQNTVLIGNADCQEEAEKLAEMISKVDPTATVIVHTIGSVIGAHVGFGMISCSFWGKDRRESASLADRIARKVKGE